MDIKNMKGFSEELVGYISDARNEPAWLRDQRLSCWHKYADSPMPDADDELWRRADLSSLNLDEIYPFDDNGAENQTSGNSGEQRGSSFLRSALSKDLSYKGVIFTDMNDALLRHTDMAKEYLLKNSAGVDRDVFALLNAACWRGGVFLWVPDGADVGVPLSALQSFAKPGNGMFQRIIIVVGNSAAVSFREESSSYLDDSHIPAGNNSAPQSISAGIVEIYLKNNAKLNYFSLQDFSDEVYSFTVKKAVLDRDASINWVEGTVGGKLAKSRIEIALQGPGANAEITGVSYVAGERRIDSSIAIHHSAPDTSGNILVKGAADDSGGSVFQGMIRIDETAQRTNSYMGNYNLLLSENARADSVPRLEIEADEVKASHGVTVGEVDAEQLFYLMSRGISGSDAKNLIVDGFFESAIANAPQEDIKEALRNTIGKKRERNDK